MNPNPTTRFSNRVADYVKWRPGYPPEAIDLLRRECGLAPGAAVADLGSGTGIFTRLLLEAGATVIAVEPNAEMRAAAERDLGANPRFRSVAGTGEATTLPATSLDLVTVAQAFHWFDPAKARAEAARILRTGGRAALIWNDRRTAGTPFLEAYEKLLERFATDYAQVNHRRVGDGAFDAFFGAGRWRCESFPSEQLFDHDGLVGRLLSSSYAPAPGEPGHHAMLAELARIFATHQRSGRVTMTYDTRVYWGRVQS